MKSQAYRPHFSWPLFILGWTLTLIAAGLVAYAGWFVLQAFLGMALYIRSAS